MKTQNKPVLIYVLQYFHQDFDYVNRDTLCARYDRDEIEQERWKLLEPCIEHTKKVKQAEKHNKTILKRWIKENYNAIVVPPKTEQREVMDDFCTGRTRMVTVYNDQDKIRANTAKHLSRYGVFNKDYVDQSAAKWMPTFEEVKWNGCEFYHSEELEIVEVVLQ